jgi:hypothetical protein
MFKIHHFISTLSFIALSAFLSLTSYASASPACFTQENDWTNWRNDLANSLSSYSLFQISSDKFTELKDSSAFFASCKSTPGNWLSQQNLTDSPFTNIDQYLSSVIQQITEPTGSMPPLFRSTTNSNNGSTDSPDSYGFVVSQKLTYPDWMSSSEFSDALLKPNYEDLIPYLKSINQAISDTSQQIKYVRFKGFSFGVSEPEDRLMIYLPGNPEKFVLIKQEEDWHVGDSWQPGQKLCVNSPCYADVAVLGMFVQNGRLVNYIREASLPSPLPLNERRSFNPGDCFYCHTSGPIAIHGPINPLDQDSANFINSRIRFGNGDWDGYNLYGKMGPGYGSIEPKVIENRTDANLKIWSNGVVQTTDSASRVRNAMNCAKCHDGTTRGTLTQYNSRMMERYILSGLMPPARTLHEPLSQDEKEALYDSLVAEYNTSFKFWLNPESETSAPAPLILDHLLNH